MKKLHYLLIAGILSTLVGCETYRMPDGSTRQVLSPVGNSLLQVAASTAIGAGTGALMKNSPSWATGAVGGAAGNVGTQVLNMFTQPPAGAVRQVPGVQPQQQVFGEQAPQQGYRQTFTSDQQFVQNQVAQPVQAPQQLYARGQFGFTPISFNQAQRMQGQPIYVRTANGFVQIQ